MIYNSFTLIKKERKCQNQIQDHLMDQVLIQICLQEKAEGIILLKDKYSIGKHLFSDTMINTYQKLTIPVQKIYEKYCRIVFLYEYTNLYVFRIFMTIWGKFKNS